MAHPQGNRKEEGIGNDKEEGGKAAKAQIAAMGSLKAIALNKRDSIDVDDIPKTPFPVLCISRLDPQRVIVPTVRCYHPVHKWGIFPL